MAHLRCTQHKRRVQVTQQWLDVDSGTGQQWDPLTLHRDDGSHCASTRLVIGDMKYRPSQVAESGEAPKKDRTNDGLP